MTAGGTGTVAPERGPEGSAQRCASAGWYRGSMPVLAVRALAVHLQARAPTRCGLQAINAGEQLAQAGARQAVADARRLRPATRLAIGCAGRGRQGTAGNAARRVHDKCGDRSCVAPRRGRCRRSRNGCPLRGCRGCLGRGRMRRHQADQPNEACRHIFQPRLSRFDPIAGSGACFRNRLLKPARACEPMQIALPP